MYKPSRKLIACHIGTLNSLPAHMPKLKQSQLYSLTLQTEELGKIRQNESQKLLPSIALHKTWNCKNNPISPVFTFRTGSNHDPTGSNISHSTQNYTTLYTNCLARRCVLFFYIFKCLQSYLLFKLDRSKN